MLQGALWEPSTPVAISPLVRQRRYMVGLTPPCTKFYTRIGRRNGSCMAWSHGVIAEGRVPSARARADSDEVELPATGLKLIYQPSRRAAEIRPPDRWQLDPWAQDS
jgi:hypothetical protein